MTEIDEIKIINNEQEAEKWFKKNYEFWMTTLTIEQKKAFEIYVKGNKSLYNHELISEYLETFKGILIEKNDADFQDFSKKFAKRIGKINEIIKKIDSALKFKNAVNKNSVYLYYQPALQDKIAQTFINPITKQINEVAVKLYKDNSINKKFISYNYIYGSLLKKNLNKNHYVFYKFIVPKNTKSGYFLNRNGKNQMIIQRNHEYIIKDVSITKIFDKEIVKITAQIFPPTNSSDL